LNYLNLEEIRAVCADHEIPYKILAEYPDRTVKATKDIDRKPIVLARLRRYLATGKVSPPTCIPARIVRLGAPPAKPGPRDRLYYRWYSKEYPSILRALGELTEGRFRNGVVARVLAMEFWTRGEAPTLAEFARAWTRAQADQQRSVNPEYAYLTDVKYNRAGREWKSLRNAKAASALQTLERIAPSRDTSEPRG